MPRALTALSLFYSGAALACDAATLSRSLDAAEAAFGANDTQSLAAALGDVKHDLGCARQAVSAADCARVHRARALAAFAAGDPGAARLSLRAMLHAEPFLTLPDTLVPADHPLRAELRLAEETLPRWTEAPGKDFLLVDGLRTGAIPVDQPYVAQKLSGDGVPKGAKVIEAGDAGRSSGGGSGGRAGLRAAGAALGVLGGGLYGGAWASNAAYHRAVDDATDDARIGRLHGTTNALSIASTGALIGAGGLLISSLLVD